MSHLSPSTSTSLLERVQCGDAGAWHDFVQLYCPLVYSFARRNGLQPADADDITQDVFHNVIQKIAAFRHQGRPGSLRNWLRTIARNAMISRYRQHRDAPAIGGSHPNLAETTWHLPPSSGADSVGAESPGEADDDRELLQSALQLIRPTFNEFTWQSFWRCAVQGQAAVDVAADLNATPQAVRQAKYRVMQKLRTLLER
ncbi:MAG: sigma-70 family RNA polymerase sigma factor [Planctomycetales bacterium]|nr:sigma-70 family RNA polymerase sigma factor [Planctomycetales bacterium]